MTCPHCGYCSHCGRGGYYGRPYYPYQPYYSPFYVSTPSIQYQGSTAGLQNALNTNQDKSINLDSQLTQKCEH